MPADERVREHIDDERLAAFVDGALDGDERASVELHLTACDACRVALAEIVRTVEGLEAEAQTGRRGWLYATAALAAAAVLVLAVWLPRGERPELRDLVAAVGERRPVEGRLTGGFKYGPLESPTRGAEASTDWRVLAAAGKLEEEARGTEDARLLGALGTAHLVTRKFDDAVKYFDQAIDIAPDDVLLRVDRAAALLARGDAAGDDGAVDYVRALDDVTRAVLKDPKRPEALFNKAMALQRMHLEDQELEAWRAYLLLDGDSAWAAEARRRVAEIESTKSSKRGWETERSAVIAAADGGDMAALQDAVRRFAEPLRLLLEDDALPASARAVLRGETAESQRLLRRSRQIAMAIADVNGDRFAIEAVEALERDPHLARGYVAWGDGRSAYLTDKFKEAQQHFSAAERLLPDNPVGIAASLYFQVGRFLERDYATTGPEFDRLAASAAASGYVSLLAAAERMRGLLHAFRAEHDRALARYDASRACYEQTHERSNIAGAHSAIAETYRYLGATARSWAHHRVALSHARDASFRRRYVSLSSAGLSAFENGQHGAAVVLHDAANRVADQWGQAGARLDSRQLRARSRVELGDVDGAAADVEVARALLASVAEPLLSQQRAELTLTESMVSAERAAPAAADRIEAAIATWGANARAKLPTLYLALGRARLRAGEKARARAAFASGLAVLDSVSLPTLSALDRVRLADTGRRLVEARVDLELAEGDSAAAWQVWESRRARGLMQVPAADPAAVGRALGPDTAVVCYAVLGQHVVGWIVRRDVVRSARIPLSLSRVRQLVDELARDNRAWAQLHAALLGPFEDDLVQARRLVVVADAPVSNVPFAGLRNSRSGRDVLDTLSVIYSPSAAVFADRTIVSGPAQRDALVAAFDGRGSGLPRLPMVEREGQAVLSHYDAGELLEGVRAQPAAVLRALGEASVFHFAGHAVNNDTFPEYSRLVLSDGSGGSASLFSREIAVRRLPRLRHVLLLACAAGDGAESRSEGPLSLARAFLEAGARSVIASTREISDAQAVMAATRLHQSLQEGLSPAEAVRRLQMELRTDGVPKWQWAALRTIGA